MNPPRDRTDAILDYVRALDPERELAAKGVAIRLWRTAHAIDTAVRRRLAPQGFEIWELEILATLARLSSTLTMGDLQDISQLTSGAITNRIGRLERDGYVTRAIDPDDRRQILVTITPAGRERADAVIVANDAAQEEVLGGLDQELLNRLADDLRTLLLEIEGPYSGIA